MSGAVDRVFEDVALAVAERFGGGIAAVDMREMVRRSGIAAELIMCEVRADLTLLDSLVFRRSDFSTFSAADPSGPVFGGASTSRARASFIGEPSNRRRGGCSSRAGRR